MSNRQIKQAVEAAGNQVWVGVRVADLRLQSTQFEYLNGELFFADSSSSFETLVYYWLRNFKSKVDDGDASRAVAIAADSFVHYPGSDAYYGLCEIGLL